VTTFPSAVLIACNCGLAAEGRAHTTCEGARFWFGRCVGCGGELMARAPAAFPFAPAPADASEAPVGVFSLTGAAAILPAAAPSPGGRSSEAHP
jgi:hypothetical protein